jgi:putative flippase GtrA
MPDLRSLLQRQVLLFLAGGILSALIDIGIMQLLIHLGMAPMLATSIGFASGLLINFAWHAKMTFSSSVSAANFTRYMCVVAINYGLTLALVSLALAVLHSALAGKIISLPIVALNSYFLSKRWIYR